MALAKADVGIIEQKKETRTIGELLDALHDKYRDKDKLSSQNISLLAKVRREFGSKRAAELSAEDVTRYVRRRQAAGSRPATINRVTECLHKAYVLAKVSAPEMLTPSEEGNEREGFFNPAEMETVLANLPDDGLRDFVLFGYITGMRKGEIESLRWKKLEDGVLKLAAEDAKDRKARTIPVNQGELAEIIKRREVARSFRQGSTIGLSEFIFHRGDGRLVGEFRKSWKTACIVAGVGKMVCPRCGGAGPEKRCPKCRKPRRYEGRIFHDLRRSAIRDLVRAGVAQKTAMEISGHKTISVFNRYNIIDERDKSAALRAAEEYRREQHKKVVSAGK